MKESESDDLYEGAVVDRDQPDPSDTLTGDNTQDPLDAGYNPPDREPHGFRGETAEETREGESLDERLAEEEPDVTDAPVSEVPVSEADERAGRLVADDEREDGFGADVGRAGYAASAEEAAVHIREEE